MEGRALYHLAAEEGDTEQGSEKRREIRMDGGKFKTGESCEEQNKVRLP